MQIEPIHTRGAWESVRSERFKRVVFEKMKRFWTIIFGCRFALDSEFNVLIFQVREITTARIGIET